MDRLEVGIQGLQSQVLSEKEIRPTLRKIERTILQEASYEIMYLFLPMGEVHIYTQRNVDFFFVI